MTRTKSGWEKAAAHLAEKIPPGRLHPGVLKWAEQRPTRERWGVAFSGGADSLALLLLLWAHWPERRRRLVALHFDHRLRGRESRGDAAFCRRVCAALGVKFVCGAWTVGRALRPTSSGVGRKARPTASEGEAREVRMKFFAAHAKVLWLGHQQDDIAETMLMRLARGSGTAGLAAPRPVQALPRGRVHLRPLLTLKKTEIVGALRAAGIPWREDSTNAGGDFFRNRIRGVVIPAWTTAAERDALAGAARSRELLEEDDAALETWVGDLELFRPGGVLDLRKLAGKPRAVWRRALHRWLLGQPDAGELSRQGFDALLDLAIAGKRSRFSLGHAGFAVVADGRLRFELAGKPRRRFQRRAN